MEPKIDSLYNGVLLNSVSSTAKPWGLDDNNPKNLSMSLGDSHRTLYNEDYVNINGSNFLKVVLNQYLDGHNSFCGTETTLNDWNDVICRSIDIIDDYTRRNKDFDWSRDVNRRDTTEMIVNSSLMYDGIFDLKAPTEQNYVYNISNIGSMMINDFHSLYLDSSCNDTTRTAGNGNCSYGKSSMECWKSKYFDDSIQSARLIPRPDANTKINSNTLYYESFLPGNKNVNRAAAGGLSCNTTFSTSQLKSKHWRRKRGKQKQQQQQINVLQGEAFEAVFEHLKNSVATLYLDQIRPSYFNVRSRFVEFNTKSLPVDHILNICERRSDVFIVDSTDGNLNETWIYLHESPLGFVGWVDRNDPVDTYPTEMWTAFINLLRDVAFDGRDACFPGTIYGMARMLQELKLPFFANYSLGTLCHIVQLSITQRKLLVYDMKSLKPNMTNSLYSKE